MHKLTQNQERTLIALISEKQRFDNEINAAIREYASTLSIALGLEPGEYDFEGRPGSIALVNADDKTTVAT